MSYNPVANTIKQTLKTVYKDSLFEQIPKLSDQEGILYVSQWLDYEKQIIAKGCNIYGQTRYMVTNLQPALFVVSANLPVLHAVCTVLGYPVERTGIMYNANVFSLSDVIFSPNEAKEAELIRIKAETFDQVLHLYFRFKKDGTSYRYAGIPYYWDITKQILLELVIRRYKQHKDFIVPKIIYRWFDKNLNVYKGPNLTIPIITFDIETVSTSAYRYECCECQLMVLIF